MTCRCTMCCRNDAGSNRSRGSYWRAGVRTSEHGLGDNGLGSKKAGRRMRRTREKRGWKGQERLRG